MEVENRLQDNKKPLSTKDNGGCWETLVFESDVADSLREHLTFGSFTSYVIHYYLD